MVILIGNARTLYGETLIFNGVGTGSTTITKGTGLCLLTPHFFQTRALLPAEKPAPARRARAARSAVVGLVSASSHSSVRSRRRPPITSCRVARVRGREKRSVPSPLRLVHAAHEPVLLRQSFAVKGMRTGPVASAHRNVIFTLVIGMVWIRFAASLGRLLPRSAAASVSLSASAPASHRIQRFPLSSSSPVSPLYCRAFSVRRKSPNRHRSEWGPKVKRKGGMGTALRATTDGAGADAGANDNDNADADASPGLSDEERSARHDCAVKNRGLSFDPQQQRRERALAEDPQGAPLARLEMRSHPCIGSHLGPPIPCCCASTTPKVRLWPAWTPFRRPIQTYQPPRPSAPPKASRACARALRTSGAPNRPGCTAPSQKSFFW